MAAALQLAPITWVRSKSTSQNPLDTPSWRVNMTQGSSSCDELRKWCGPCCLQKAAHAGRGVAALRRRLAQPQATLHVSVVGNSVARFNNFGVARGFVHELRRRFPATKVTIEYAHVAGGFEPDHLYYCGLSSRSLLRADLVLIHYHAPRGGLVYEKVLRRLLALPRRPVVAYVAHCTMSDFSYHRDWVVARDRGPWGWRMGDEAQGYFEQLRAVEHRLVSTHYGLPFASTCAAFHSMLGAVDQSDRLVDTSFEPTVKPRAEPTTLYAKGKILGYKRSKANQYENTSLIKIEHVNAKADTDFYLGKRVAYIYKAKTEINGTKFRAIWGKVCRAHGNNGVVRCKFRKNLPPTSIAGNCRVMLYPSRI
ncbi:hypothetical protein Ctob_002337 [Chrysochromulina tobinii]|uniref:60S ribosomal protein L35a n=1 Tax=Chrysochromulina tobinii TaxID=1460289 RepID=A0A0M0JQB2_9EUKA|nr:hypothetical protein Ctob_002337 [Chrysochromulina tobinii]|eukprot:KOO28467.1 hypothetical protein Ctob_002337 [Chrysochromulina sp. CCMP291]